MTCRHKGYLRQGCARRGDDLLTELEDGDEVDVALAAENGDQALANQRRRLRD